MKTVKKNAGITLGEVILFTVFLAVAGGASVFFFFLNSDDVKKAQQKFDWVQQINSALDAVSLEIANAAQFDHPFAGSSRECFFKASVDGGTLLPDEVQDGFGFSENSLVYLSRRSERVSDQVGLGRLTNPLVSNCREGKFIRIAADKLEIRFKGTAPDGSGKTQDFYRLIYLRNQ